MDDLVQSEFTFLNPRLFVEFTFVSECIWCLYNKQKNRWLPVDMEFPVSCSALTSECSEREEKLSTTLSKLFCVFQNSVFRQKWLI